MAQVIDRTVGANPTGFDMRTELNNIIAALESDNSGSSEPLNPVPYMKWLDTSNATYYYYKERNHDNTAWVTLFRYTVATKVMEVVSNGVILQDSALVHNTGNETVAGIKTFTASPIVPTPTDGDNSTKVATTAFVKATSEASSIGVGQTWKDVAPSRTNGITYTNSTGKPIQLSISGFFSNGGYSFYINGIRQEFFSSGTQYWVFKINQIIPNGSTYSLSLSGTDSIHTWFELR
jgi:hypothetical protein